MVCWSFVPMHNCMCMYVMACVICNLTCVILWNVNRVLQSRAETRGQIEHYSKDEQGEQ